jgi:hypothetical protein
MGGDTERVEGAVERSPLVLKSADAMGRFAELTVIMGGEPYHQQSCAGNRGGECGTSRVDSRKRTCLSTDLDFFISILALGP